MATLIDTCIPSASYNLLPHIQDVSHVPEDHSKDLEDLRSLLTKHQVPNEVSIRLIHKHFDTRDGEVMIFRNVNIKNHGLVKIMSPNTPQGELHGIHFFVREEGSLQAYEYSNTPGPSVPGLQPFLDDFCNLILERGLQHKFGLKFKREDDLDNVAWTEFELHDKRSTVMLQHGMPMPGDEGFDFTVSTEWKNSMVEDNRKDCKHVSECRHRPPPKGRHGKHCKAHDDHEIIHENDGSLYLGGQRVMEGTPAHDMVSQIMVAV